ncbi:hypothetical protein [Amycolatopsis methanolica]|uniref:hypothetical protein n=1 Tax=Amycolatopsis methanolica TaxID=1814 RepID=UPI0012E0927E|nr:hypothetical protein [Amycolatopsis methanolica]
MIIDGRVEAWNGYHRAEVRTLEIEWGVAIRVGIGQSFEGSEPVVHLRILERDNKGEAPYDVVLTPGEAVYLGTSIGAGQLRR